MFRSERSRKRASDARRRARRNRALKMEELEPRQLLSGSSALTQHTLVVGETVGATSPSGLTPAQVRAAYGFTNLKFGSTAADGSGQTIAIIDVFDAPTVVSDLAVFDKAFGIAAPPSFKIVNQNGGTALPPPDPGGDTIETALDVEWAHAIAPGANILLVEANDFNGGTGLSPFGANVFAAIDYARRQPGVSVISMSLGTQDSLANQQIDQIESSQVLVTPAGHQGVTFVASSGDDGWAVFPSISPNVLAVGGTLLTTNSTGQYLGESAWGLPASQFGSGGGGASQEFPGRKVPDVSYNAAPESGVAVYDSFGIGGGWLDGGVGGTSAGAPQWSALLAIANQGRTLAGLGTLDGPAQTLPALYAAPASDFHDIIDGTNNFQAAGPGYDLATGLGTPVANHLIPYLAAYNGTSTSVTGNGTSGPSAPSGSGTNAGVSLATVTAPGNFTGSPVSTTQVSLSWSAASGATGYKLYQFKNGQATLINTFNSNTLLATVSGLTAGTTYSFDLVAFNGSATAATPWISVTTTPLVMPPSNFTGAPLSNTQISLSWSAATGATGYRLYQFINGQPVVVANYAATATSATVSNLIGATTYSFDLVAFNGTATAATPWISVTTSGGLLAPTNFTGTALSASQVSLSWSLSTAATGYRIYQFENGQPVAIATYDATTTAATVNSLTANTTYSFDLVAFNGGATAATPWVSVTTLSLISPPGSFTAAPLSGSQISLSWSAAAGATGYSLYQIVNGSAALIANYGSTITSATVSGLAASTTYYFNLVAFNIYTGATAATQWIGATTLGPLSAPTNFTGMGLSSSQISLSWTAASGAAGYRLYEFESGAAVLVATYSASTTTATVSGLTASTSYALNLVAFSGSLTAATPWISVSTTA